MKEKYKPRKSPKVPVKLLRVPVACVVIGSVN